ncbi:MAG: type I pullulanase [Clostridia bacterium]|nr:type I pullulanase [Clostridia bacterium]
MKRSAALLLVLLLLFGMLSGCKAKTPDETVPTDPPKDEYTLEPEEGCNQLIFYWYSDGVDYSKCDMWIWYPDADGRGYLFHECDYGAKVILNVPEDITEVGFIVRKDCSDPGGTSWGDAVKDYDGDRFAAITGKVTEVYLKPGDGAQYLSDDGGKTLYQAKLFSLAGIVALDQIKYNITPATRITSLDQIKVKDGDRELEIVSLSSLNNEVVTGIITVGEELDISKTYVVEIEGFDPQNAVPTQVFDSPGFIEKYAYDGELGAFDFVDATLFKFWAPTASDVKLNLYSEGEGGEAYETIDMVRGEKGVWSAECPGNSGFYYTYTVTTAAGTNEIVDPYAKAVGVNGNRGMVVDLDATDPEGWANDRFYDGIDAYNEAVIWEVHVRDFSNRISGSQYPGKYLAFTETGLKNASGEPVGIDYLVDLGITHVHLQPVYDYATVDESSDEPQFNWGYDPKNYNVPEGSYSTDPYHGEVRIKEFKQMVKALHDAGIGVVMDVVYNHTYSADSNLSAAVPYYYYRYDPSGKLSNGSGCGNETASDRVMFRKFMVDSVKYWAEEYHIDGFRFDLMALHDVETMQAIETAVHEINPRAIIYGEGWTGGTTTLMANKQANQANISKIVPTGEAIGAVSVFNDSIRDGLKGSVFNAKDKGYINGNASSGTANRVIFGIMGGVKTPAATWSVENNAVINYMACHDNNTLWDKLEISNPEASVEERMLMNRLGASIIMISKGTPFFLAGEEMLRTKDGDHNSYKSSDAINNIDWDALTEGSDVMRMRDLYRSLIAMRRANRMFTECDVECSVLDGSAIEVVFSRNGETVGYAVINPNAEAMDHALPEGEWGVLLEGWSASASAMKTVSGSVSVEGRSVLVVIK